MTGRTSWWAKDAAWHRRELIVELGEENGPGAVTVMDTLSAWAQEQRAAGWVRGGFRALARESFVTVGHAQSFVSAAAAIGALDELQVDDDGRRFDCRVSGWTEDQSRGRASFRKQNQREREALGADESVTDPDESRSSHAERDESRSVTEIALPNLTIEREGERASASFDDPHVSEVERVLRSCPRLQFDPLLAAVTNAIAAYPDVDHVKAAHIAAGNASDPNYRTTDAGKALRYAIQELERTAPKPRNGSHRNGPPPTDKVAAREARFEERAAAAERAYGGQHDR